MADDAQFKYVAVDSRGRKIKGSVTAINDAVAFDLLRQDGLSPLALKQRRQRAKPQTPRNLTDREASEFLMNLAELLQAGADIRTALNILSERFEGPRVKAACEQLSTQIGGGDSLERAFTHAFQGRQAIVGPMVSGGEAAGDLAGGLRRAAEIIQSRLAMRDQVVSVMAYPAFVFVSAIGALLTILIFIVPSIAPLATEMGAEPSPALAVMITTSDFLRANWILVLMGLAGGLICLITASRLGMLSTLGGRLLLDGPLRRIAGGLLFGGFAISLGTMLAAGAPIGEALRLAIRAVPSKAAKQRLEPILSSVRQGAYLSNALAEVKGFPATIVRMVAVGEASNAVGTLLIRSGKLEEDGALKRIEAAGKIAGPALIIFIGALLGVLMGGLLSSVSTMGQAVIG
jgi:type II secretory pathway component PulF